jgi:hypothetical protein
VGGTPWTLAVRAGQRSQLQQQRLQPAAAAGDASPPAVVALAAAAVGGKMVLVELHHEGGTEVVASAMLALELPGRADPLARGDCSGQLSRGGR